MRGGVASVAQDDTFGVFRLPWYDICFIVISFIVFFIIITARGRAGAGGPGPCPWAWPDGRGGGGRGRHAHRRGAARRAGR